MVPLHQGGGRFGGSAFEHIEGEDAVFGVGGEDEEGAYQEGHIASVHDDEVSFSFLFFVCEELFLRVRV